MVVYIGMFGFVAKVEVIETSCYSGQWTVKVLKIYSTPEDVDESKFKNIDVKDVKEGDEIVVEYGWLFNTKKLAVAYAEKSKMFETTGHSLLGLPF
jgi:SET domain-containing protein